MNLTIYADSRFLTKENSFESFIFQCFFPLCEQHPSDIFTFLTYDKKPELPANVRWIQQEMPLLEKILGRGWRKQRVMARIKKYKTDVLITLEGDPLPTTLPQIVLLSENPDKQKIRKITTFIKTRPSCIVLTASHTQKRTLLNKGFPPTRIFVLPQSPSQCFKLYNWEQKEQVKQRYASGKAYFLLAGHILSQEHIIMTLKAFSQFKRWQQSNMQFLIAGKIIHTHKTQELLKGYKYKDDVRILNIRNDNPEYPEILSSCMTMIYFPENHPSDLFINEALQCGTPIIVITKDGYEGELNEPVLSCNIKDTQNLAGMLIKLYKDEAYRLALIEQGNSRAITLSEKNVQNRLWKHIQEMVTH